MTPISVNAANISPVVWSHSTYSVLANEVRVAFTPLNSAYPMRLRAKARTWLDKMLSIPVHSILKNREALLK